MYPSIFPPQPNQLPTRVGNAYLKFRLDYQTLALLPMEFAQEVVVLPSGGVTPVPRMPACVWGLINRRNKLLWTVDLAQMLGFRPLAANLQQYNLIIIRVGDVPLALVVQDVQGVVRFPQDSIQSPVGTMPSALTLYLQGCILEQKEVLLVLDPETIAQSPILHRH